MAHKLTKKRWKVELVEVRYTPCTYIVEALTAKEAQTLAEKGETEEETCEGNYDVNERFVTTVMPAPADE